MIALAAFELNLVVAPPPGFGVSKDCLAKQFADAMPGSVLSATWETDGDRDYIRLHGQITAPDVFIAAELISLNLPGALRKCHLARDAAVVELLLRAVDEATARE